MYSSPERYKCFRCARVVNKEAKGAYIKLALEWKQDYPIHLMGILMAEIANFASPSPYAFLMQRM